MEKSWEKYIKLIPVIYGVIVIISFIKIHIFYLFFNLNISEYLQLSELLVLFLDDLLLHALSILLIIVVVAPFLKYINKKEINKKDKGSNIGTEDLIKEQYKKEINKKDEGSNIGIEDLIKEQYRAIRKSTLISISVTILVSSIIFLLVSFISLKKEWYLPPVVSTVTFILYAILIFYLMMGISNPIKDNFIVWIILYFAAVLTFIIPKTVSEAISKKHNFNYSNNEIEYKKDTIRSDSVQFFIGKTANYIFYYNKEKHQTTAFPLKDVGYIK